MPVPWLAHAGLALGSSLAIDALRGPAPSNDPAQAYVRFGLQKRRLVNPNYVSGNTQLVKNLRQEARNAGLQASHSPTAFGGALNLVSKVPVVGKHLAGLAGGLF